MQTSIWGSPLDHSAYPASLTQASLADVNIQIDIFISCHPLSYPDDHSTFEITQGGTKKNK